MWAHVFGGPETAAYEKEREKPASLPAATCTTSETVEWATDMFRPKRILPRRSWSSSSIVWPALALAARAFPMAQATGGRCPRLERLKFGLLNRRPSFRAPDWVDSNFRSFSLRGKGLESEDHRIAGNHTGPHRPSTLSRYRPLSVPVRGQPSSGYNDRSGPLPHEISLSERGCRVARPMQRMGIGSPKEDIVAKLMRTALLIGLAVTWRPDAAAGQYSWSGFSVSFGLGIGVVGVGASYVDPWYSPHYPDPCWDYAYYEIYWYECPMGSYRWPSYRPYYSSHFSISLSFGFGYRSGYYPYRSGYYGYGPYRPYYPVYGYVPYVYQPYGVVYRGGRTAYVAIRPSPYYRVSPLGPASPLYKESPRRDAQRTAVARTVTPQTTAATRSVSAARVGTSTAQRNTKVQAPETQTPRIRIVAPSRSEYVRVTTTRRTSASPTPTSGTRPSRAQSPTQTPRPISRVTVQRATLTRPTDGVRRVVTSSPRRDAASNTTPRRTQTSTVRAGRSSRAAPRSTARSNSGVVTRSTPTRTRATQPSARRAPTRTQTRAPASRSAAPRATTQRSRASSGGASRATPRARVSAPARGRAPRR